VIADTSREALQASAGVRFDAASSSWLPAAIAIETYH
jgi:hypothetical protein